MEEWEIHAVRIDPRPRDENADGDHDDTGHDNQNVSGLIHNVAPCYAHVSMS